MERQNKKDLLLEIRNYSSIKYIIKNQRDQWTPSGYPFSVVLKVDQRLQRVKIIYKIEYCLDLCILRQKVALFFFKSILKTHKKKVKKKFRENKKRKYLQISRDLESKTWSLTVEIVSDGSGDRGEGYAARVFSFEVSLRMTVWVFNFFFFC